MKYCKLILIALAAKFFLASTASAQTHDVSGVKLGMSFEEAEKALEANGFGPAEGQNDIVKEPQPTFIQHVSHNSGKYIPPNEWSGLGQASFYKNKERIDLHFIEYPSGAFVGRVSYSLNDQTISVEDFNERVISKYGPPTANNRTLSKKWPGDQNLSIDKIPSKETLTLFTRSLRLEGKINQKAYKKAIEDATPRGNVETSF